MRRALFTALLAVASCVDSPSYDGRVCTDLSPCPEGYVCAEGVCQRECENDEACANGNRCVAGVCSGAADASVDPPRDSGPIAIDTGVPAPDATAPADASDPIDAAPSDVPISDTGGQPIVECVTPADCAQPGPCQVSSGASCESGRCRYPPQSCTTPPAAECVSNDTIFRNYTSSGRCEPSTGQCEYTASEVSCPSCRASCLAPCESVSCDEWNGGCRSEAFCQPGAPGQLPQCVYTDAPDSSVCALAAGGSGVCTGGRCVRCTSPAHCDDGDRCTTDSCGANLCSNTPNNGTPELCNNFDDDCNGVIDNDLSRSCSTSCGSGTETCSAGNWSGCTAPQPQAEVCDNADNNCNGSVDDGLSRACSTACGSGTETCSAGSWVNCSAQQPRTEVCDNADNNCNGSVDEGLSRACSTACGSGTETCSAGSWRNCSAPQPQAEICDNRDNNCNGSTDEIDCTHEVFCTVFDDGYTNQTGTADAIFTPGAFSECIPGGANGICRRWFGRCIATGAADGHSHTVQFRVFDDGYTNMTGLSDAILISGPFSACIPGGANGICRRWFGRGETNSVQNHTHTIRCTTFEDGYASQTGLSDAVLWNGSQYCVPGGANGVCRRWFGRCTSQ